MTHLETFALVIVTAIVLAVVQEGVRKLMSPKKDISKATLYITQTELEAFCKGNQEKCSALKIVAMIKENMEEFRKDLKSEMVELRKLVSKALVRKSNSHDDGED